MTARAALRLTARAVAATVRADVAKARRGVALLIVMVTVAVLIAVSSSFAYSQLTNIWMSGNITAATKSYWSARGALKIATLAVNARQNFPQMSSALAMLGRSSQGAANIEIWRQACEFTKIFCTGRASFFGMDIMDFTKEEAVGLSQGECSCEIESEDKHINLNAAATDTAAAVAEAVASGGKNVPRMSARPGAQGRTQSTEQKRNQLGLDLYGLLRPMLDTGEFDSEEEMLDLILNIMDWTDSDDSKTDVGPDGRFVDGGGGEDSDYKRWDYEAKNAKMDTVGEAQLIDGMTTDVWCHVRDKLTVFATDKINVNDADRWVLRGILCEAITDEALRLQYCYAPLAAGIPVAAIDELIGSLEQCRQIKKQMYSTPFTDMGRFTKFIRQYPASSPTGIAIPFDNNIISQHLDVRTKMVRVVATGRYCKRRQTAEDADGHGASGCTGTCVMPTQGEDGAPLDVARPDEPKICKEDADCGGGFCQKRETVRRLTQIIDTSTGALVHFKAD
jgi:hypothetical protein